VRLFTAIKLSDEAKEHIQKVQAQIKKQFSCKRWQKIDNMHLTLHFLGEVEGDQIHTLQERIHSVTNTLSPFTLCLDGYGAFPNESRPRVIWIGIGGEYMLLKELQASLAPLLKDFGYEEVDQVYSPHITIGRNPIDKIQWEELRLNIAIKPIDWMVENIVLFQSQFTPQGVVYTVLDKFPLIQK
jgi:2'-5' RNA ligase